jgi:hypothetical protein
MERFKVCDSHLPWYELKNVILLERGNLPIDRNMFGCSRNAVKNRIGGNGPSKSHRWQPGRKNRIGGNAVKNRIGGNGP